MRGGAIAIFAWAAILALLGAINWIWSGRAIQVATFGFAVLAVLALGGALALASPEALRRGQPERSRGPEAVPSASLGAVLLALGFGSLVFGLAFGHFLIYFGIAVMLLAAGRLIAELRAQRRARERAGGER